MDMIGSAFFDDLEAEDSSPEQNATTTYEKVDLELNFLSYIPETVKLDMLKRCFENIMNAAVNNSLQVNSEEACKDMRLVLLILKEFHLKNDFKDFALSSFEGPRAYQAGIRNLESICTSLLTNVCVPAISCTETRSALLSEVLQLSEFFVSCCLEAEQSKFIQLIVELLNRKVEMDKKLLCIESLSRIYGRVDENVCILVQDHLLSILQKILPCEDEPLVGNLLMTLMPKLVERANDLDLTLKNMWNAIETCFNSVQETGLCNSRAFMLLCGCVDMFFPSSGCHPFVFQLLGSSAFWKKFQLGFLHSDQLTRKRTLYIFRRILAVGIDSSGGGDIGCGESSAFFRFDSCGNQDKTADVWLDFLLLIETLEEKQIHVIQPVLIRFSGLLKATKKDSNGCSLLHVSWVLLLFRRMAGHESAVIRRWAMFTLLHVDPETLTSDESSLEFLCGPFVEMLTDSSIYYKSPNQEQSEPLIHNALLLFFNGIHGHLDSERKPKFWTSFFEAISATFWNGGVLVYVSSVTAQLSKCKAFGCQSVHHFRKLLTLTVLAHDAVFRMAIQSFLIRTFFNFVDLVDVESMLTVLGCLSTSETLHRGNQLWHFLVEWLKNTDVDWQLVHLLPKLNALITDWMQATSDLSDFKENPWYAPECRVLVRLLLLALDAGLLSASEAMTDPVATCFAVVRDVFESMNKRAYLSEAKVHQTFILVLCLLQELDSQHDFERSTSVEIELIVTKMMSELSEEVTMYVTRKLMSVSQIYDYKPVPLYLELLKQIAKKIGHSRMTSLSAFHQLVEHCCAGLSCRSSKGTEVIECIFLETVGVICALLPSTLTCDLRVRFAELKQLIEGWTLRTEADLIPSDQDKETGLILRHLRSGMLYGQWVALSWYFRSVAEFPLKRLDEFVEMANETIDVAGPDVLVQCFEALCYILPKVMDDKEAKLLQAAWCKVQDYAHKSSFWPVYTSFVSLAFQKDFMERTAELETFRFLGMCYDEILQKSEEKSGMLSVLVNRVCVELDKCHGEITPLISIIPYLEKSLAFGPVNDKAKRLHIDVQRYLHSLKVHFTEDDLRFRAEREDASARVQLLSFLSRLNPSSSDELQFGKCFAQHLVTSLGKLVSSHRRSYANTTIHRSKHRLLVALLILEPFVEDVQGDYESFAEFVIKLISEETQPSVRFLGEWLFIRLARYQAEATALLLKALGNSTERKPAFACSLLVIVVHVAEFLVSKECNDVSDDQKTEFLLTSLSSILLFCMSSNFNIRAFAHAALVRLWTKASDCMSYGLHRSECTLMKNVHSYIDNNRESFWAAYQLLDNHYCFKFHPEKDFSVETLVFTIPYLSGMTDEEWLSVDGFSLVDRTWKQHDRHNLPLTSDSSALKKCTPGGWKSKPSEPGADDERLTVSSTQMGNVQKKLIPWQSLMAESETIGGKSQLHCGGSPSPSQDSSNGLILVASLVDRIPNLGGLCRTCEIFAVSKFIIGSKRYMEDKEFEILSVTSHKWINIEEVLPNNLVTFLLEAKKAGYTLVGAEQTAKSCCLSKFKFPKKTILILGNERHGIPVHILQVLDVCIEIPQSGMIRSLNVHVTGALFIWEYYKQWNLIDSHL